MRKNKTQSIDDTKLADKRPKFTKGLYLLFIILVIIISLGVFLRTFYIQDVLSYDIYGENIKESDGSILFLDPDTYFHGTVIFQAIKNGKFTNRNDLDLCYKGSVLHPHGYYFIHYLMTRTFGEIGFWLSSIVYYILTMILLFLLVKALYNKKIALLTVALLSFTYGNAQRSEIGSFRGENIIMPLLLLSLLMIVYGFKLLNRSKGNNNTEKKTIYYDNQKNILRNYKNNLFGLFYVKLFERKFIAIVVIGFFGGLLSGISLLFWNGSSLVVMLYCLILIVSIFHAFFSEGFSRKHIFFAGISFLTQALTITLSRLSYDFTTKTLHFIQVYYYIWIIVPLFFILYLLYIFHIFVIKRVNLIYVLAGLGVLGLIGIIQTGTLDSFIQIFRLDQTNPFFIDEMLSPTLKDIWLNYYIFPIFFLYGIFSTVIIMRKFFQNKNSVINNDEVEAGQKNYNQSKISIIQSAIIMTSWLIPSLLLLFNARRFLFFASFPIMIIASFGIYRLINDFSLLKKKTKTGQRSLKRNIIGHTISGFVIWFILFLILASSFGFTYKTFIDRNTWAKESYPIVRYKDTFDMLKGIEDDACVYTRWDIGSYSQFFGGVYTYISSVGQNDVRIRNYDQFMKNFSKIDFNKESQYFITELNDLKALNREGCTYDADFISQGIVIDPKKTRFVFSHGEFTHDLNMS
jgi:asparagine N-glycosylation enzyme membrane subunit Stt3